MLILDILQIPIEFIRENLTGWILLIIVVFIIYFICLRKYYIQREKFYDIGAQLKNLEDVESAEDNLSSSINLSSNTNNEETRKKDIRDGRKEYKQERKVLKNSNGIDKQFNQNDSKTSSRNKNTNTKTKQDKKVLEEFDSDILRTPKISTIPSISIASATSSDISASSMPPIATTLFDNLNLNNTQIQACKANYNQVIAQLITDLGKLSNMASKNPYLNLKKQFDSILAKCVDNIMNYITITIKSPRILTRTAIRTEVISTLNNTLENLIDKTNQEIATAINKINKLAMVNSTSIDYNDLAASIKKLAIMNSTSIDYKLLLRQINDSRASLEKYITIAKLINQLGHNINVSQREISSILDKSYILPIYERNFDKISQLAKSDFNDNEGNLAMKYSKAYGDFLEQEKKEELNINPLSLASQIESGIVNMLSSIGDSSKSNSVSKSNEIKSSANITGEYGDNWYISNGELKEQMTRDYGFTNNSSYSENGIRQVANNPIPKQELSGGLLSNEPGLGNVQLNRENIFSDPSNRGSYMINRTAQGELLEGFVDPNINNPTTTSPTNTSSQSINPSATSPSLIKAFDDSNLNKKNKNQDNGTDITSKLLSGDFLQYMLDTINGYMSGGYDIYKDKLNNYLGVQLAMDLSLKII